MPAFPQALPLGTELGNFELKSVLGQGGGGFAYLCYDSLLEREVVLKEHFPHELCRRTPGGEVVAEEGMEETFEQSLNLFLQEARTLAGLRHAGIVRILDVIPSHGTALAVMEPVAGAPLDAYLTRHADAPPVLEGLLRRLLEILAFLHAHHVIHRDIKPANIVVQEDGTPILLDFGAALRGEHEGEHTIIGTPGYAAPEQFTPKNAIGPWSDLYALALSFIQVLGAERVGKLPRRMRRSLYRAARKDADQRYLSAEEWLLALNKPPLMWWAATSFVLLSIAAAAALLYRPQAVDSPAPLPTPLPAPPEKSSPPQTEFPDAYRFPETLPVDIPLDLDGYRLIINPQQAPATQLNADLKHWGAWTISERLKKLKAISETQMSRHRTAPFPRLELSFPQEGEGTDDSYSYYAILMEQCALLSLPRTSGGGEISLLLHFSTRSSGTLTAVTDGGAHVYTDIPFELELLPDQEPQE